MITDTFPREQSILLSQLPEPLIAIFAENYVRLCGGAITSLFSNTEINDFDLYFGDQNYFSAVRAFFDFSQDTKVLAATNNALTYEYTYKKKTLVFQLISAFFGNTNILISNFDFRCCMGAYNFATEEFILNNFFLKDIAQRRLIYNENTSYPLSSLIRIKKYISKGYAIDALNLVRLALSVHKLEFNTYGELKKHLQGIDILLHEDLSKELDKREQDVYEFNDFVRWLDLLFGDVVIE